MTRRRTMTDIARLAGVSPSAVSFALNGREGVSEETRQRILQLANEVGWVPNAAARALKGGRASAVGLVLTRPAWSLGIEPFFLSFVFGLESQLSEVGCSLLMHTAADLDEEISTYRKWWAEGRVDGAVLLDLRINDPRPDALVRLGLPTIVVGDPDHAGSAPAVWTDDAGAMNNAVQRLAELGHRRLARVTEDSRMAHTYVRNRALYRACAELSLPTPVILERDGSPSAGVDAMEQLLDSNPRPTAVFFDNDLMAVTALSTAQRRGVTVPEDISIIAYDDSILCTATQPVLSALQHDVYAYGAHVADAIRRLRNGQPVSNELDSRPTLLERGSVTAAPQPTPGGPQSTYRVG